jgi:hypothetical protein
MLEVWDGGMILFWVISNNVTDYQKSKKAVDAREEDSRTRLLLATWLDSQYDSVTVAIAMEMNAAIPVVVASTFVHRAITVGKVTDADTDFYWRREVQIVFRGMLAVEMAEAD